MENSLLEWFPTNPVLSAFISIGLNIIVAITGVLPSAFITLGTIGVFGFKMGLIILILGEAAGAIVSFMLYRMGVNKLSNNPKNNKIEYKFLRRLKNTSGIEAFMIVILLRILPFVPSGAVTLTAAISKMSLLPFSIASTLGKIPALYIEAYSTAHVLNLNTEWQIGLFTVIAILFISYLLRRKMKEKKTH